MNLTKLTLGPLSTNCYIVWNKKNALIFDPADQSEVIIQQVKELNVKPAAICLTHAHFDHIGALEHIRNHFNNVPVFIHEEEKDWLMNPDLNGSSLFGAGSVKARPADHLVREGEFEIGDFTIEARHTPGHSPGGMAYILKDIHTVIGGDSLFSGGIGRTDLQGGDQNQLIKSIQSQFYTLPDDYIVYPGHGPETTIKEEKMTNPFVQG